eukprot:scaffold442_cov397-Prasinococcus_capsulatus_cf.AAC.27
MALSGAGISHPRKAADTLDDALLVFCVRLVQRPSRHVGRQGLPPFARSLRSLLPDSTLSIHTHSLDSVVGEMVSSPVQLLGGHALSPSQAPA